MLETINLREAHAAYQRMPIAHRLAIDQAFAAARDKLEQNVLDLPNGADRLPMDDRAEVLVAALAFYLSSGDPPDEDAGQGDGSS